MHFAKAKRSIKTVHFSVTIVVIFERNIALFWLKHLKALLVNEEMTRRNKKYLSFLRDSVLNDLDIFSKKLKISLYSCLSLYPLNESTAGTSKNRFRNSIKTRIPKFNLIKELDSQ